MTGAREEHKAQHAIHQKALDIDKTGSVEHIGNGGTLRKCCGYQEHDTDNDRKQHKRNLIGQLGDLLVKESEQTNMREDDNKSNRISIKPALT